MKSRTWMWITTVCLFTALTLWMAAQDNASLNNRHQHHHYKLIDLGTFGGPSSFAVQQPSAQILSNSGKAAGCADTSATDPSYPNFNFFLNPTGSPDQFLFHGFGWNGEFLEDLGALPGANSSCGLWVSDSGLVAGGSENGLIDPLIDIPEAQAILWRDGHLVTLGSLGGYESVATSVNDQAQVVGAATNTIPDPNSGFGTQLRAFLWERGRMRDLGTLGGANAFAVSINDHGQVFGASSTNTGANDGFLWDNGRMQDIPDTLGGSIISPFYLNNRGQVVGTATVAGDEFAHPFFWQRGAGQDLGTFGGDNGEADWVNDLGQVVGSADFPGDMIHHGFLWQGGAKVDLGTLSLCSRVWAINVRGQIVGNSSDCQNPSTRRAIIWEEGQMVDLNTLITSDSGLTLLNGENINDSGEITGAAMLPNGDQHVYLLIPCDEKHPGQCEDYSIVEVPDTELNLPAATRATEPLAKTIHRFQNLEGRYHLAAVPVTPRY